MRGQALALPRIGLTTSVVRAQWGPWDQSAVVIPSAYLDVVAQAGGLPVLLAPIVPGDVQVAAAMAVAGLDGLVLAGGPDIGPTTYGDAPHPETDAPDPARDAWELALLQAALAADQPVLAVCRGVQLMNVACGGTLHQHLPEVLGAATHRAMPGSYSTVPMVVVPGSRLHAIVGEAPVGWCHHHQAIDRLGDGLRVSARAADGTIEGVELDGSRFALGVQWHPEAAADERLFAALVAAAGWSL